MDEVGVQSKHRARQFVTKLWVSDCKGNFHLATCLCDNGSEVNLQSNSFLPDDCVFESPHPVTLEGVSGHSLAGGQRGCYISTHLVAQDLWEEQNVEEVVLKDDYFYRADIKYDLYLGHPWLRKNRVAPVGHRRCFLLESGPLERPEFRFLHAGVKSAEEFLKQKVTPKFGEDVTIAEVNGSADYSQELECLRRDSQPRRPSRWHSSSYRVVDKWRDAICEYFHEHHSFWPQYDAFANRMNKRFDKHFSDAWTHKWDKKLWINPPFHLIQQVIHKIKQDKTQAILVVPLWDDKPWFQELQDICVDYIELPRMIKLYARDDTGPLPQRSWPSLAFLVDGKLTDSNSADSGTDSCVGSESEVERGTDDEYIFSDFCPSDTQGDSTSNGSASSPSSPIRSTSKRIFSARARKNLQSRRKFRVFYEKPPVEAFMDPFEELDREENLWDFDTGPTYLQEAVDTDLFRDIRKKILPAKAEEVAKVFSTVIPGDQVDTELCSKSREKIFEERKDTTLSGKLIKDPPVRGQFGEAFIELREGYKAKKQRPYENHGHKHEILRKIIERNLREFGWLEGCMTSEWCCSPFTVPKPPPADQNTIDGWRMVVDFRNLNAETKADSHPLPLIEEEIAKRARGRLFSVLDLRHGFHQMPLRKDSRHLTCMCTPCGPVQWTVMPMGLKNAPSFFQRMMEDVLFTTHPELRAFVSVYIDDIIIATEGEGLTEAELVALHEKQLNQVLDILDANQLICGPKKGKLFLKSVEFCGSLLENGTRRPSPGKLVAIQKWKRPETITELRGFLGCCNFYHTFVPNYAKFAAPLTELLKVGRDAGKAGSKVRVKWTDECEEAFHHLKAALCEVATLHVPQFDRPFYIRTDASRYAIGAVLEQVDEATGDHYPLAFWSRKLAPRQMQWSPREQETYAIICALKKYQSWVGTNRVEVLTDHRSLEYWATEHIDTVASPAGRRARWHEFLSLFDLHVSYLPGKHNTVADALSRWAYPASEGLQSTNIHGTEQDRHVIIEWDQEEKKLIRRACMQCAVKQHALPCHDITAITDPAHAHEICTKTLKVVEKVTDPSSGSVKRFDYTRRVSRFRLIQGIKRRDPAKTPPLPKDSLIIRDWTSDYLQDPMFKEVFGNLKSKDAHRDGIFAEYSLDGGKLWMEGKLCVPDALAPRVLNWWHKWESPHAHGRRLWSMIKHRLFGSRLYTHCMKVAAGCAQCAVSTPPSAKKHGHLRPHPIPERLFNRVTSDFFYLGELDDEECHWTNKKVNGVLLIQCRHSGYIQVLPCNIESMTGKAAAKWCAQTWMGGWDVPSEVVTDSGKEYTSEWWRELCARLGIHHLRCEIHSHRALPGERAGRSIINMLRKELASEKDFHWMEVLFALLRRYHNTPLYHGLSPNEIAFGRKKCWWNMPLNNPRPCKDASLFLDEVQRADKSVSKLIEKHQADWLWVQNQGRKNPHNFEVDDRVWLRKSETTLDGDDKLLPLWEGPFAVTARLGENRWRIRVDVSREIDVSGDRLKREIPSPKDRVKPLFWTAKHLSDRVIEGGKYELKRIVEARRDAKGEWEFLCEWRGFDSSHNNWEPAQSFVHGYTKGFIDFLKKHPEIGVLLTDCLSKPDRQVESDGKRPVVNRDPAFYGPQQPHSRADPSIPPPAVRPAQEPNEDQASSSAADLQRPSRTRARPDRLVVTCIRAWPN